MFLLLLSKAKQTSRLKVILRLFKLASPLGPDLAAFLFFSLLAVATGIFNFTLFIPLLNLLFGSVDPAQVAMPGDFKANVDYVLGFLEYHIAQQVIASGKVAALARICILIVASVSLSNLFRYLSQQVLSRLRTRLLFNLRRDVFSKLVNLDFRFYHAGSKGQLLSTVSNDVHEVETAVISSIQAIARDPLLIIGYFTVLFSLSPGLTLFTLVFLPVSFLLIAEIARRLRKDAHKGQELLGSLMGLLDEAISGIRIIKGYHAEQYAKERFETENKKYRSLLFRMISRREAASPLSEILGVAALATVCFYGGSLVLSGDGTLSASEFITYLLLYAQVLSPAKNINSAVANVQKGLVCGKRILAVLDAHVEIFEKPDAVDVQGLQHSIRFHEVGFMHGNTRILNKINLEIRKGMTVALVGPSGAGKSTLTDLLPRFYDVNEGAVLIDGVDIRNLKLSQLRKLFGIVNQETILFNDTLLHNIAFGDFHPDSAKASRAAETANALGFISEFPDGFQTMAGDRGARLSGGQRQRISIARAVYNDPPVLILDEATSALDSENEVLVQEALARVMKGRTTLVVAHRLSTIQRADLIVVLDKGEIVETGTHKSLLQSNGLYKRLYDMQEFRD